MHDTDIGYRLGRLEATLERVVERLDRLDAARDQALVDREQSLFRELGELRRQLESARMAG